MTENTGTTGQSEQSTQAAEPVDAAAEAERGDEVIGVRHGMFGVEGTGDTSGYGRLVRTLTMPGSTPPPYGGYFDELIGALRTALSDGVAVDPGRKHSGSDSRDTGDDSGDVGFRAAIEKIVVFRDELTLHVRRDELPAVARALRDDPALRFELCLGVSGAHYPDDTDRELHAVYHLMSITHNRRVRLEVSAPDADPHIPSLCALYPTNDWHERETYDFFGILFDGHPALTRIAMPDDWRGHPQRKDYPLGGIPVEYKGARIPAPDQRRTYH
ncbi:NADH-quinone oxidoreductase subunit C [Nocardia alni]|uniref:NADH-quinone oxidoreductase subunit C n=1 Tax=Nocardia alni TaxID=2815723 RepID=UPI003F682934